MQREIDPEEVSARLAQLHSLYEPEDLAAARDRLERERPRIVESFADRAARSLAELRALCELSKHLHHARLDGVAAGPSPSEPRRASPPDRSS